MNPSELVYRQGNIADKEQLRDLGIIAYGQYHSLLSPEHSKKLHEVLMDRDKVVQLLDQATCFVCEHNNQIVGMAYLVPSGNPWDIFLAEWSYIRMVGVHPNYAGKGIAKHLTGMCINLAKKNNEKTIALHTSEFMHAARHVYESLGFKVLKEIEPRFGKRYWLYTKNMNENS